MSIECLSTCIRMREKYIIATFAPKADSNLFSSVLHFLFFIFAHVFSKIKRHVFYFLMLPITFEYRYVIDGEKKLNRWIKILCKSFELQFNCYEIHYTYAEYDKISHLKDIDCTVKWSLLFFFQFQNQLKIMYRKSMRKKLVY